MIITKEMLFNENVHQIINKIKTDWGDMIQYQLTNKPDKYPDFMTWLELNPSIVGVAFIQHLINYGYTDKDINQDTREDKR